jgi:hypothetical protein
MTSIKSVSTSSGIIRNPDIPRVGVIGLNSEKLHDWIHEVIHEGIDLTIEELILELQEAGKSEEEIEEETQYYESDSTTYLIGDAWKKNEEGKYSIDKTKSWAGVYRSDSGNITIEWSQFTRPCHHTSPCYIMADGSGPCGDLETPGNSVIAYDLPPEFYRENQNG